MKIYNPSYDIKKELFQSSIVVSDLFITIRDGKCHFRWNKNYLKEIEESRG